MHRLFRPFILALFLVPFTILGQHQQQQGNQLNREQHQFEVPLNRKSGSPQTIDLSYTRFATPNPNPLPPLLYLGPKKHAQAALKPLVSEILKQRDIILMEVRGTGKSSALPVVDPEIEVDLSGAWTREDYEQHTSEVLRASATKWRAAGFDLSAYNVVEIADDIEALRQNLGVEKLALLASAYGSHVAQVVMRRHGDMLERVVLHDVVGMNDIYQLPSDIQPHLEYLDEHAAGLPVLKGNPLTQIIKSVLASLQDQPVTVELKEAMDGQNQITISAYDLKLLTVKHLQEGANPEHVAQVYMQLHEGDFSMLGSHVASQRKGHVLLPLNRLAGAASGVSPQRFAQIERERDNALLSDAANRMRQVSAGALGVPDLGDEFRKPVRSEVPTLLIASNQSPRFPARQAKAVAAHLHQADVLIVEDAGSGLKLLAEGKTRELLLAFLAGREVASQFIDETSALTTPGLDLSPTQLAAYTGSFQAGEGLVVLKVESDVLTASHDMNTIQLLAESETTFFNQEMNIRIHFSFDQQGKVTGFSTIRHGEKLYLPRLQSN